MVQVAGRKLGSPVRGRVPRPANGPRIERAPVEVPSIVVRLAAVKAADCQTELILLRADRQHAGGNVRRILQVMGERGLWNLRGGNTVRVCRRPERRVADWRRINVADGLMTQIDGIFCGELHEEI